MDGWINEEQSVASRGTARPATQQRIDSSARRKALTVRTYVVEGERKKKELHKEDFENHYSY